MSTSVIDQSVELETEVVAELPEITGSQLVFDYGVQSAPTVCPSAGARAV
ncbi:hypothetical protein AB0D94_18590 [Streptomyces sp. NPDC048255]